MGVSIGVCPAALSPDGWPARATECPIIIDPAGGGVDLLGHDRWDAWRALDCDSGLLDDERRAGIVALVEALAGVAEGIATLADLRAAAAAGHLDQFVRKDARTLLEDPT
ncbi:hypothetical protein [Agromyces sp. SYSU T00194]|uniref:hypothetical protein n=1 Tax=Agromyces chitinivorans TaxID=3158560 RepID=UPI0033978BCD